MLTFNKHRQINEPDPDPSRNFAKKGDYHGLKKGRMVAYPQIALPLFKQPIKYSEALRLIGYNVRQTMTEAGKERDLEHKCEQCGLSYDLASALKTHILLMHSNRFKCEVCDYTAGVNELMKRHMKTHGMVWQVPKKAKLTSFPCGIDDCKEEFATPRQASNHRKFHREEECVKCHKMINGAKISQHYQSVHNMKRPKKEQKVTKHYCKLCDLYVSSSDGLNFKDTHWLQKTPSQRAGWEG